MKIMIAYDGSDRARMAMDDLEIAGLPRLAETRIVSVVEPFLPAGHSEVAWGAGAANAMEVLAEHAEGIARQGRQRIQRSFPEWEFETELCCGRRATQLVAQAADWEPELLVINPLNRSEIRRVVWGSLSRSVVDHAPCSVRVARNTAEGESQGLRLLVGYDGSRGAEMAVCEVALRQWPANTEARLVAALATSSRDGAPERRQMLRVLDIAAQFLRDAGLKASISLRGGQPRRVLLEVAGEWGAHCIFVGRNRHNTFSRKFLGSTSAAIASQALCSVEVVREKVRHRWALTAVAVPARPAGREIGARA
ncbi:MAG: universal stress protein [Blastocatellia bacterium]